jgi:hypothetical protein
MAGAMVEGEERTESVQESEKCGGNLRRKAQG